MSMFKKQYGISPSGYKYTQDPVSVNPFFTDGDTPSIDKYLQAVSCETTTTDNGKNYTFKYTDQSGLEYSYVTVFVPNAESPVVSIDTYTEKVDVVETEDNDIKSFAFTIKSMENNVESTKTFTITVPSVNYIERQIDPVRETADSAYAWKQRIHDSGTAGQVLTKTDSGEEWKDAQGGSVTPGIPYTFHVEDGILYCYYSDGDTAPVFDYNTETGELYLVQED